MRDWCSWPTVSERWHIVGEKPWDGQSENSLVLLAARQPIPPALDPDRQHRSLHWTMPPLDAEPASPLPISVQTQSLDPLCNQPMMMKSLPDDEEVFVVVETRIPDGVV